MKRCYRLGTSMLFATSWYSRSRVGRRRVPRVSSLSFSTPSTGGQEVDSLKLWGPLTGEVLRHPAGDMSARRVVTSAASMSNRLLPCHVDTRRASSAIDMSGCYSQSFCAIRTERNVNPFDRRQHFRDRRAGFGG